MSSYKELSYTHLFTNDELNEIQKSLNGQSLDFISEMNLSKIPYLKRKVIKFNFSEYQNLLYTSHFKEYDETKIEPLMYSDSLKVVKYLFPIYRQIYLEKKIKFEEDMIELNKFLNNHPSMTVADFVDMDPYSDNINTIKNISTSLGLPLNCELSYSDMLARENKIFNRERVYSEVIQIYEYIASLNDEEIDSYLKNETSGRQYKKKLTE